MDQLQVAQEIVRLGKRLTKDARCRLVVGEVRLQRQLKPVSLLQVAKSAETGVICMLDKLLTDCKEAIDAAKACASQEGK